ncbi:MAG: DUF2332 family protein [Pseudomonadota bacterium]
MPRPTTPQTDVTNCAREAAVRAALAQQGRSCVRLGSPFMGRLMALLAERDWPEGEVARAVLGWPGDPGIGADNPALRLAGGLHRLVIAGADDGLAAAYPPHTVSDDALWLAVTAAFIRHEDALLDTLRTAPQTNEVRRAAAIVPALNLVAAQAPGPLALWEIGCSGGLNLCADRFRIDVPGVCYGPNASPVRMAPKWEGGAPPATALKIAERRGVDLAPIDPRTTEGRLRLLSYLWPDQPHRAALTEGAIGLARDMEARIDAADAVAWLARRLPARPSHGTTILFHTVAWQYLPEAAKAEGETLIAEAGAMASDAAPLARIAMEADGGQLASLTLTRWPGGQKRELARVDFHGRSVSWTGPTAL